MAALPILSHGARHPSSLADRGSALREIRQVPSAMAKNGGVQQGLLWLVFIGVVNSVVSAYYYIGVIKAMFLGVARVEEPIPAPAPLALALVIATAGTLLLGIFPGPAMDVAAAAASSLVP